MKAIKRIKSASPAAVPPFAQLSGGNVFADLDLPDAGEMLAKAELAHEILDIIEAEGLTQAQAAARMGIDQPKVSALRHGRLKDFSTDRLMRFLNALGRDVVIAIRTPTRKRQPTVRVITQRRKVQLA
jgi:predicted XRE-type DNA-binding protein